MGRFLITAFFFCSSLAYAGDYKPVPKDIESHWEGNGYSVNTYRDPERVFGAVQIYKDGKLVFKEDGFKYQLGLIDSDIPEAKAKLVKPGMDITGSGQPNLVVSQWTGGAHCCFEINVFSLGKDFKLLGKIENDDGGSGEFKDVDGDGKLEFIGHDFAFAYWHECFAASPSPGVVLKFRDGKYSLALDLMKKPVTSDKEVKENIKKKQGEIKRQIAIDMKTAKETDAGQFAWILGDVILPSDVWARMLDLIYSSHPKEAWTFLDEIWPKGKPGKEQFIREFKEQLSRSKYWSDLKPLVE
jgi:hypothetical protein